jgi:hypothetical protein
MYSNIFHHHSSEFIVKYPPHHSLLHFTIQIILGELYKSWSFSLCIIKLLNYFIPLTPKYCLESFVFKHLYFMFFPRSKRPCFTHIQNNQQEHYFGKWTEWKQVLNWMTTSISWIYSTPNFDIQENFCGICILCQHINITSKNKYWLKPFNLLFVLFLNFLDGTFWSKIKKQWG